MREAIDQELDDALDQIRAGLVNQGAEAWEKCFREGCHKLSLTEALFLKHDLAAVLFECGLVEDAKRVDQQISDELCEEQSKEWPSVSFENGTKLDRDIQRMYFEEAESPGWTAHGGSSNEDTELNGDMSVDEGSMTPWSFRDKGDKTGVERTIEVTENRMRAVTSDEVHLENRRTLPEPNVPERVEKAEEESRRLRGKETLSTWQTGRTNDCPSLDGGSTAMFVNPGVEQRAAAQPNLSQQTSLFLASNAAIGDSSTWLFKFDLANKHLESLPGGVHSGAQVKIAILDTGCDINDAYFRSHGIDQVDGLRSRWHDCLGESVEPTDQDGKSHGTALAVLLLQLAPRAALYLVRVARDSDGLLSAKEAIKDAILLAAEWGVDVISMSFGFNEDIALIRNAIVKAEEVKGGKILFFAAANNDGLNEPERFPAFSESVISVRGTHPDGSFVPLYNPRSWAHKAAEQYGTLAKDVPCGFFLNKSGCSVATPIMAAIAAAVIAFVERESVFSQSERDLVRTRRGMLSIFRAMADGQNLASARMYMAPWHLFENGRQPLYLIGNALSMIPQHG